MFRLVAAISIFSIGLCVGAMLDCTQEDMLLGQQQLINILNAAWVRVLNLGEYRAIKQDNGVDNVTIDMADCLPIPDYAPFPDVSSLVCNAKYIITDSNIIKFGRIISSSEESLIGIDTSAFFSNTINDVRSAIIAQVNEAYDIEMTVEVVPILPFLSSKFTAFLNDGTIDLLDQLNALGGRDDLTNELRRNTRLFTCTLISSGQYFMTVKNSPITTADDVIDLGADVRICSGQLSTQTVNAFFPQAQITTIYPTGGTGDIETCILGLANGDYDVYATLYPTPSDTQFAFKENKLNPKKFEVFSIDIVAGTPYWAAKNLQVNEP